MQSTGMSEAARRSALLQGIKAFTGGEYVIPQQTEGQPLVQIDEADAFSRFYTSEHGGQVRRAFLLLNDAAAAHDVVAEAFTSVYQRFGTISDPGPYLNRCVLNGCRDWARRRDREDLFAAVPDSISSTAPGDHLAHLLAELPFGQRAAVVLRFYGGQSEREIAVALGCRPGTVGSLIHRGLRRLRTRLDDDAAPETRGNQP